MLSCPVRLLDGGRLSLCRAPERRSLQCHARRRRRSGGDEPAGAPAEALVSQLLERLASKEDLDKLASKEDLDKLASKEDLDKLAEKVDAVDKKVDAMSTLMGSLYDAAAAGVPEDRRRIVYRNPLSLAADCGLPHDAAAGERVAAVLVEKHEAAHAFRMQVMPVVLRQQAKASDVEQEGCLPAAVSSWRSLPQPQTAAEWAREEQALRQVAGTLKPGSEVQQAVLLLRKYSTAAAQVEAEGRPDALRQLLSSMPPPGAKEWPSAMALAQGLAGMWSRELELDAPLRLGLGSDSLVIQETKLTAGGVSKAMRQLRHAFRLVAWLHFALGAPLPRLEGRIVVPHTELREAQRKLHRTSRGVQDSVPGGGGARFDVSIMADTV